MHFVIQIRDWIQLGLSLCTLLGLMFGVFRVVGIAQKGIEGHEARIGRLEDQNNNQLSQMEAVSVHITALSAKFEVVTGEMERMRNRLDRFLDMQSAERK